MTIVKRAVFKSEGGPGTIPIKTIQLSLMRVEKHAFRWIDEVTGNPFDGVDYVEETDAVKALRVLVETDPKWVGIDLTVFPVAPPPEERAARRIVEAWRDSMIKRFDLPVEQTCRIDMSGPINETAEIIRNETAIDKLVESTNVLVAYLVQRIRQPRPPGLDMAQAGLLLDVLTALEKAQNVDLSNIRKVLTQDVTAIKTYSSMPQSGGKIQ